MKRIIALVLALSLVLTLAACGAETASSVAPISAPEAEPLLFTDDCGREVTIPAQITRIVPSGPLAQMILFAIAPDMVVGLASKWYDNAQGIIPQEYLDLPYLGQLYGSADLNVETLALADPQLIIDIGAEMSSGSEDMDTLQQQTGIPSVFISASLEAMPETFRKLGTLLGREEKGEELARFCEKVYDRTASIMEQVGDNKISALYILGEEGTNVLAKGSYHSELLDLLTDNLAVVENPLSKGTGNEVGMEQISLWNPEFLIFAPGGVYSSVMEDPLWSGLSAVSSGNYVEVPDAPHNWMGTPPGVQRYLGLIWLTAVLYPDYCDYDVKAEVMEYYRLFYGADLTEEQYADLTANAFLR